MTGANNDEDNDEEYVVKEDRSNLNHGSNFEYYGTNVYILLSISI